MKFGETLRSLRKQNGMTQTELAGRLGISLRTVQNYEACKMYPKQSELYAKIAALFHISVDALLCDEQTELPTDLDALVAKVGSLFSGGKLSEEDKDKVLYTITELYWKAKAESKQV